MSQFRISLRLAIAAIFALVLLSTVGLQALSHRHHVDRMVERESARLLEALTSSSEIHLKEFLDEPFRIQRDVAYAIECHNLYQNGDLTPVREHLKSIYTELYTDQTQLSVLAFGTSTGDFVGFRRDADRSDLTLMLKDKSTNALLKIYKQDVVGDVVAEFAGYDPRLRPWYAVVERYGTPSWSPIYANHDERAEVTVSAVSPIKRNSELIGVMVADIKIGGLNQFLHDLVLRGNGVIFISDLQGRLVAQSDLTTVVSKGSKLSAPGERKLVSESDNSLISAAAVPVRLTPTQLDQQFVLDLAGQNFVGRVSPYNDPRGLNWRIVAVLPEADLLGEVRAASQKSLFVIAAIAALALAFGLWAVGLVARPVLEVAQAAKKLSMGDWNAKIEQEPSIVEASMLVGSFNEMAEDLKGLFNKLGDQLRFDQLTGLRSLKGLYELANWVEPQQAVLCLIGLDSFRTINDSVGVGTGDRLLLAISARLRSYAPASVLMARSGGDEFAMLFVGNDAHAAPAWQGSQILGLFQQPFSTGDDEVKISASVGVVSGELPAGDMAQWLRHSSIALSEAKRAGRGHSVEFEPAMLKVSQERASMTKDLHRAIENNELLVHYQPVVHLQSGRVSGAEALVRWQSPTRGMVSPASFIPVAEETDLILKLGEWVLRRATFDISKRLLELGDNFELHVNVSARQLIQSDFLETLATVLTQSRLPATCLTLELTESVLVGFEGATVNHLAEIRAMGVKVAIDDFGTGYSSLAYLDRMPFDCIKIDQSFVRKLQESPRGTAVIGAVLHMATAYEVDVVAEGVETQAHAMILMEMGCAHAQGYWFGRPAPLDLLDMSTRQIQPNKFQPVI